MKYRKIKNVEQKKSEIFFVRSEQIHLTIWHFIWGVECGSRILVSRLVSSPPLHPCGTWKVWEKEIRELEILFHPVEKNNTFVELVLITMQTTFEMTFIMTSDKVSSCRISSINMFPSWSNLVAHQIKMRQLWPWAEVPEHVSLLKIKTKKINYT